MKKIIPIIISVLFFAGCTNTQIDLSTLNSSTTSEFASSNSFDSSFESGSESSSNAENSSEHEERPNPTATLICAGDNLIHSPIYKQASARTDGNSYDFRPVYEEVKDLIAEADLAVLNQESIITDEYVPSNYPRFCTPEDCGDQMIEMGFDAVSISNNHVLDRGEAGLKATLKYWNEKHPDIIVYGASTKEKMDEIPIAKINGITFAFLGFTEHTNGYSLPNDTDMKITYLKETERIKMLVEKADKLADVVVVSAHYGLEVSDKVTDDQKKITQDLVNRGADIIIGTQPHTAQPMEYVTKPDGTEAFVFYCLGNLVSAMDQPLGMIGMLGKLTVTKDLETGKIILSEPEAVPIVTHYESGYANVKIYRFENYTKELAEKNACPYFTYDFAEKQFEKVLKIVDYLP